MEKSWWVQKGEKTKIRVQSRVWGPPPWRDTCWGVAAVGRAEQPSLLGEARLNLARGVEKLFLPLLVKLADSWDLSSTPCYVTKHSEAPGGAERAQATSPPKQSPGSSHPGHSELSLQPWLPLAPAQPLLGRSVPTVSFPQGPTLPTSWTNSSLREETFSFKLLLRVPQRRGSDKAMAQGLSLPHPHTKKISHEGEKVSLVSQSLKTKLGWNGRERSPCISRDSIPYIN